MTPYVGVRVGFASVAVLGLKDVNVPNDSIPFGKATPSQLRLGGLSRSSYNVAPAVTIDLSYRYPDIGNPAAAIRTNSFADIHGTRDRDITSRDAMLGMHSKLRSAPTPMPDAFK